MRQLDSVEATVIQVATLLRQHTLRRASDPFDFGDDSTIGLRVRRVDIPIAEYRIDQNCWGTFVGQQNKMMGGEFVILSYNAGFLNLIGEAFASLDELKERWCLD